MLLWWLESINVLMDNSIIWSLSVAVTSSAMGHTDGSQFPAHCNALYDYFNENLDEIIRDDKLGFHVGSAFYFMGMCLKDSESEKYKFSMLSSFLNLYSALPDGDMQACIAAHRLFILLAKDKSFFDWRILAQSYKLDQLLSHPTDDMTIKLSEFKMLAYDFLSQFVVGNGSVALSLLNVKEQSMFKEEFARVSGKIKTDPVSVRNGNVVFNALRDELISAIDGIRFMGVIA